MLGRWLRTVKVVAIVVGVLLSFFAVMEVIRAYQTLYGVHPWAGYVFAVIVAGALAALFAWLTVTLARQPAVLLAPRIADPANATTRELRKYAKYLTRYISRLLENRSLTEADRAAGEAGLADLRAVMREHGSDPAALLAGVRAAEETAVRPLLERIDETAARQIRNSMRDVMIGVTVSPYKALDLFIVIYRNIAMVIRIIHVYNSRPRLRETLRIGADIAAVVATVNYINMGRNLIEGIGSRVPGIGRFIDDIAQGMGAGFMTTVVGHAAMDRCRAFRGWDKQAEQISLGNRAYAFYGDVRDIFKKDVLPAMMRRVGETSRDTMDRISAAIDETGQFVAECVRAPINAAASASDAVWTAGGRFGTYSRDQIRRFRQMFGSQPDVPTSPIEDRPPERP